MLRWWFSFFLLVGIATAEAMKAASDDDNEDVVKQHLSRIVVPAGGGVMDELIHGASRENNDQEEEEELASDDTRIGSSSSSSGEESRESNADSNGDDASSSTDNGNDAAEKEERSTSISNTDIGRSSEEETSKTSVLENTLQIESTMDEVAAADAEAHKEQEEQAMDLKKVIEKLDDTQLAYVNAEERQKTFDEVKNKVTEISKILNSNLDALAERDSVITNLIDEQKALEEAKATETPVQVDYETGNIIDKNGTMIAKPPPAILQTRLDPETNEPHDEINKADPALLHEDLPFMIDLVCMLIASCVGGWLAVLAGVPVFVGFVLGGTAVGPGGFGLLVAFKRVEMLNQIAGPLMLFLEGVKSQSSIKDMVRFANVRCILALVVFICLNTLGYFSLLSYAKLANSSTEGFLLGLCMTLSSTSVLSKLVNDSEDMGFFFSIKFKNLLTFFAVGQDFLTATLLCLPVVMNSRGLDGIGLYLREACYMVIVLLLLFKGFHVLAKTAWMKSSLAFLSSKQLQPPQDLSMLTLVTLALAIGLWTRWLGLSSEMGAFLTGLVLTRFVQPQRSFALVGPVRDLFSCIFFGSLGLIISPRFLYAHMYEVLSLLCCVVAIKIFSSYLLLRYFKGIYGQMRTLLPLSVSSSSSFPPLATTPDDHDASVGIGSHFNFLNDGEKQEKQHAFSARNLSPFRSVKQQPSASGLVQHLLAALCMSHIGEFTIFIAGAAVRIGLISRLSYLIFTGVAVLSLLVTPIAFRLSIALGRSLTFVKLSNSKE